MADITSPNFAFLASHDDRRLLFAAAMAERQVFADPNSSMVKSRQFAELLAAHIAAHSGVRLGPEDNFFTTLRAIEDRGVGSETLFQLFHSLRRSGNRAVHNLADDKRQALLMLGQAWKLAVWFHWTFGDDPSFRKQRPTFTPPPPPEAADAPLRDEIARLRDEQAAQTAQVAEAEEKAAELYKALGEALERSRAIEDQLAAERERFEQELAAVTVAAEAAPAAEQQAVQQRAIEAGNALALTEAETRQLIDEQLREAGWEADSVVLRHSANVRPQKSRNLAIAEWPTASGPADYMLFAGLTPIAVVEAKRNSKDVAGDLTQSKRYSEDIVIDDDMDAPGGPWDGHHVPFLYATNGRPFLRQLAEKSGIWFRDARRSTNHPRALEGWHTPAGLSDMLDQDTAAADAKLAAEKSDYLPLRDYQHDAVRAVEAALADGQRHVLLAMATGTGKTRTSIGLVYRLVKSGRFRRVLFLIDRTALGEQAANAFKDVRLESQQTFADIFDVKELGDLAPDRDTRLHFATVQGMVRRLMFEEEAPLPVDAYDCIVVDECHRGYTLDQEMTESELRFRDQDAYISAYRRVLDHFDAVKIGLTATPALHTTDIFGDPVYVYDYRQAVVDGYLVDHEPPVRIVTKLAAEGIHWQVGEEMAVYDPQTNQLRLFHTEDEVHLEIDTFNRDVQTEAFNRVVCEELARHIDPSLPGKTLVFCATDLHADMVVRLLKEAFTDRYGEIEDGAVLKITGRADKPLHQIRRFKNERLPDVAVTVDLLTTGVDVPQIVNIVFLRRVRSRILYEQMMGRATRLCPEIDKEVFLIFDAVDLYAALRPYSTMQPVVTQPDITFETLVRDLAATDDAHAHAEFTDQLVAKLRRKLMLLEGQMAEDFEALSGMPAERFADMVRSWTPEDRQRWLIDHAAIGPFLDRVKRGGVRPLIISRHEDELVEVATGFGSAQKPEDYLRAFEAFVKSEENQNRIPALKAVTQRPRNLTRADLRELRLALDREGYSEPTLRAALRETTNADIAASIIGYIRHMALGSPLEPYVDRVDRAMQHILTQQAWTMPQRKWLERIALQLRQEIVVDRAALDRGQFMQHGGYKRLDKVFDGQLLTLLDDLHEEVWRETG